MQDTWEGLYRFTVWATGAASTLFFVVALFGSYYFIYMILAIVAMSYDYLQRMVEESAIKRMQEDPRLNQ